MTVFTSAIITGKLLCSYQYGDVCYHLTVFLLCIGLPDVAILPDLVANLATHSSSMSRPLIERLILNFPHKWPEIWDKLLNAGSNAKPPPANNSTSQNAVTSRSLSVLYYTIEFTADHNAILNRCVSVSDAFGFLDFFRLYLTLFWPQIQLRRLPDLVMHLAMKLDCTSKNFSLQALFKRIFFDEGQETRSWFANYLKFAWVCSQALFCFCTT